MTAPGWQAEYSVYRTATHYANRPNATMGGKEVVAYLGGISPCPPGRVQCILPGGTWYCADIFNDPFNCGGCCRTPCPEGEVCCRGTCLPRERCPIPLPPISPEFNDGCPLG